MWGKCTFQDNNDNKILGSVSYSVRIIIQSINSVALNISQSSKKPLTGSNMSRPLLSSMKTEKNCHCHQNTSKTHQNNWGDKNVCMKWLNNIYVA